MLTSLSPWTLHGSSSCSFSARFPLMRPSTSFRIPPGLAFTPGFFLLRGFLLKIRFMIPVISWFIGFETPDFSAFLPSPLAYHRHSLLEAHFLYSSTSFLWVGSAFRYLVNMSLVVQEFRWCSGSLWLSSNEGYIVVALDPLIVHSARSGCLYLHLISSAYRTSTKLLSIQSNSDWI